MLGEMGFDGENLPVIKGSALAAVEDKTPELGEVKKTRSQTMVTKFIVSKTGKDAIEQLMEAVDNTITTPERELEEPFFMPIEHVHSIVGR